MTHDAVSQPRNLHQLTRWAAFTGIALMLVRRLLYITFPTLLPSSAWRGDSWVAGTLATMCFELVIFALLLAVPFALYSVRRCTGPTTPRDLWIDCSAVAGLYLTALLLL